MRRNNTIWAGLAMLGCAGPLLAHHTGSMYDTTPIWIEGTVVGFEDINPHTITTLEQRSADGQVRRWAVEGPARFQIERARDGVQRPELGDELTFCAFPYKSAEELARLFPDADFSRRRLSGVGDDASPPSVAGHVMLSPDGERQIWEPHGLIGECILSSAEPRRAWLDFLSANARARQAWCEQRGYAHVRSTAALSELVEEIDASLADPCR